MPKYEPGDTVIVRPDIAEHQGDYAVGATYEMIAKAGQVVTILAVDEDYAPHVIYKIEEDCWNWDEIMFVGMAEEGTTVEISNSEFLKALGM